jgi:hypothetical protein
LHITGDNGSHIGQFGRASALVSTMVGPTMQNAKTIIVVRGNPLPNRLARTFQRGTPVDEK